MKKLLLIGILAGVACSGPTDSTPEPVWVEKVLLDEDFTGIGFFNLPKDWTKYEFSPDDKIRILPEEPTEGDNYYVEMFAWDICSLETPNFREVVGGDKLKIECRYIYTTAYSEAYVSIPLGGCDDVFLESTRTWKAFSTTLSIPLGLGPEASHYKHYYIYLQNYATYKWARVCIDDVIVTRIYQK